MVPIGYSIFIKILLKKLNKVRCSIITLMRQSRKKIIQQGRLFKIFWQAALIAIAIVAVKYILRQYHLELIPQSSLHNSVVSSVVFVIGFLLSATIADYKESERIPAEFAAQIEDMYDDAAQIHASYPVFDLDGFRKQLCVVARGFVDDARKRSYDARQDIRALGDYFSEMERGKVPPNFIVKLKQQQGVLLRARHRVNYIQRITFVPSATILARSIVAALIILLVFTDIDPFYAGLAIVGTITFTLVYMLILIHVISKPFHKAGKTRDDVSLFLINDAVDYLRQPTPAASSPAAKQRS